LAGAGRCGQQHDLETHVLRHAPYQPVRTGQRRAAAEDEGERRGVDRRQGGDGPDDVKILFHQSDARQPEMRLDFQ
jgi:hypothetical protein